MNRKAAQAWEIYSRMETSAESLGKLMTSKFEYLQK